MASPANPFVIDTRRDHVHWIGDSLVEWYGNVPPGGGIAGPLMREIWATQQTNARVAAGGYDKTGLDTTRSLLMPFTQNGHSGTGIKDISDNVQTRVITPMLANAVGRAGRAKLILQASINDGGPSTFNPNWDTYIPTIASALSAAFGNNLDVLVLPILFGTNEDWDAATGLWAGGPGSLNDLYNQSNAHAQAVAAAHGWWWIDWRGTSITDANTVLKLESTLNTGHLTSGVLTYDGVHPIATSGEQYATDCLKPSLDIRY